ncbi:MAG: M48 family metallopeptidase [Ignavibacteriae bacterium]|nr:M48 family metallopeptidase [Ignavibacteriota bacterium]
MEDKSNRASRYARTRRILSLTQSVILYAILLVLLFTGLSKDIAGFSYSLSGNDYIALLIFLAIVAISEGLITFPLSFYSGYILEHKYQLSNQSLKGYFGEALKGLVLMIVIGVPVVLGFYFILKNTGEWWWFFVGVFMFLLSVVIGRLAPVLIMPLFYKFKSLDDEELKERIIELCKKTGINVEGIFSFDMSKNTKKANAAFTGMGKSKRIILGDTLLEKFTPEEIEFVFAHEMGHYVNRHLTKLVLISTVSTFLGLYITSLLFSNTLGLFGFTNQYEIAALPLLFLYLSIYGLITTPITNIFSRKYEWEADTYALETTRDRAAFISSMEKLAEQNLSERTPNKIIEFLFHSHPSLSKRIEFARNYEL